MSERLGKLALIAALVVALAGCDTIGNLFSASKTPLPGKRISVLTCA